MIKLHARLKTTRDAEPFVARIVTAADASKDPADNEVFYVGQSVHAPEGFHGYLVNEDKVSVSDNAGSNIWQIPAELEYLTDGDIIRISPRTGELWVMYRRNSPSNSLLLTEQCNSNCIMCSQPPKSANDSHLVQAYLKAIPLMSLETKELGITGGEPTLLGESLFTIIQACKDYLPNTSLHMLTNGRMFNYVSLCRRIAEIEHPDLMLGIPIYADLAHVHDFVVQAPGAFDQTIRGLMNLARFGVRIEVRMVLHGATIIRLPQFATFVARNLPFVDHLALMGLEMMGYVRMNLEALWVDPADYQHVLCEAVETLLDCRMNVSIYNHQLCVLDRSLWPVARKSISDWKNEYVDECRNCLVRDECGGFFSSSGLRRSRQIKPLEHRDETPWLCIQSDPMIHVERAN